MLPSIHLLWWRVTGVEIFNSYSTVEDNESAAARIYRSEDLKEAFLNSLNVSLANANGVSHVVLAA